MTNLPLLEYDCRGRKLKKSPDGAHTVRLTACVKEAGVKIKTRDARIDFDRISNSRPNIVPRPSGDIAAKPRSLVPHASRSEEAQAKQSAAHPTHA
jgi:hypothetical protein